MKHIIVIGPNTSPEMKKEISALAKTEKDYTIIEASIDKFKSGEVFSELFFGQSKEDYKTNKDLIEGSHVTIVQSTGDNVSDSAMQLMFAASAAKRNGAKYITAMMPFAAFARQDRQFDSRMTSVAAEDFANLLKASGITEIITCEMHSKDAENYFKNTFPEGNVRWDGGGTDFVSATETIAENLIAEGITINDLAIGAPDGADKPDDAGQRRARNLAQYFCDRFPEAGKTVDDLIFKIGKTHTGVNDTKITSFEGDVTGKTCVIIDDMADSGGTLKNAGKLLKEKGAKATITAITHGIFTGNSLTAIMDEKTKDGQYAVDFMVVTDTISSVPDKIKALDLATARRVKLAGMGKSLSKALKHSFEANDNALEKYRRGYRNFMMNR